MVTDAHGDIRRRAAYKALKGMHFFQRLEVLFHLVVVGGIKVNGNPAQQNQVKRPRLVELNAIHNAYSLPLVRMISETNKFPNSRVSGMFTCTYFCNYIMGLNVMQGKIPYPGEFLSIHKKTNGLYAT